MNNFQYKNPTKILFGRGQIAAVGKEIPAGARVMVTYGGGSIRANGVYEQTMAALSGREVVEFGGIGANPEYETLMRGVEAARAEGVDFLLAAGGGSVVDGTKFMAAAMEHEGEPWEILTRGARVRAATAMGCILTLPATGSESNAFAVISRRETGEKLAFASEECYPRFAVLDPETTFTLPARQVANGVVDAFVHTLEQYLTYPVGAGLQDRMAEAILLTLIEVGPRTLAAPEEYESRATFMWPATLALNGLIGCGAPQDWATHMIGHELTALYGIDHARTLAAVLPHLLRVEREQKGEKLAQYAERVWGVREGSREERIEAGVRRTEEFFESLGLPASLSAYEGVGPETARLVASRLAARGEVKLGERGEVTPGKVEEIVGRSWNIAADPGR